MEPRGTNQGLDMGRPLCSTCMDRVDRVVGVDNVWVDRVVGCRGKVVKGDN